MKIVSAAEMREIDRITSDRFGVPSPTLMENAGTAALVVAIDLFDEPVVGTRREGERPPVGTPVGSWERVAKTATDFKCMFPS